MSYPFQITNRLIKIIFGVCLFVILCIGGFSYKYIKDLSKTSRTVEHTYLVNLELEKILSQLKDAEIRQSGFLLTNDSLLLKPFFEGLEKVPNSLSNLRELTKENKNQQANLANLEAAVETKITSLKQTIKSVEFDKLYSTKFKDLFIENRVKMDTIRAQVIAMVEAESQLLSVRQLENEKVIKSMPFFIYTLLIFTLLLLLLTYLKINKDLKRLQRRNEQLLIFKEAVNQAEIIGNYGNWQSFIEENRSEYSDNLYRILGEEPQSFPAELDSFMYYVHPDDKAYLELHGPIMLNGEDTSALNFKIIRKNGEIRHLKANGKLIYVNGRKQVVGITTDVTDEIEQIRLMEERTMELERNNKELSAFNHVASHDLQEPLRKIQTFISRLEANEVDSLSDNGKFYLTKIKDASARMRLLIDDLLQFSKTNKTEEKFSKANLNTLLDHAKQELAEIIAQYNATITTDELPTLQVIPFQVQQLFTNLIGNSLKYSRENIKPNISISYKKVKAAKFEVLKSSKYNLYHELTFIDNGIGFDQQYAEKIFILFNRLHGKKEYSGTGIGLSICKKIVDNHSGYITAYGNPNNGATFKVYLPIT